MIERPRRDANKPDAREQPAYTVAEGARYLRIAAATLRSWVVGRPYPKAGGKVGRFQPLVHPPRRNPPVLTFWNLVECHVLWALRREHRVELKAVRDALKYAEESRQVSRLLLSPELCTTGGELFLDKYGELINLSRSGQLAMKMLFAEHLKRVEWDRWQFPVRLYPFVPTEKGRTDKPIAIDANIAFGRPVLVRAGVSTSTIATRIDAGETVQDVATDYGVTPTEVEEAILYERAA